jgi:hypothetical protein
MQQNPKTPRQPCYATIVRYPKSNSCSKLENPKLLKLFLDSMLKTDLGQEGGLVPLTSTRFQRLSRLVEGVVIDD